MTDTSVIEVTIKERENATPGERVRAVGMCFYGRGVDLTTGCTYKLRRNPTNPKDRTCIEVKERHYGQVKATLNAKISRLLSPFIDNTTIWETTWYVKLRKLISYPLCNQCNERTQISTDFNSFEKAFELK